MGNILITVEVAFVSESGESWLEKVSLPVDSLVFDAIRSCSFIDKYKYLLEPNYPVGIWGSQVEFSCTLQDGDRVEIYRELRNNPNDRRKSRAVDQGYNFKNSRKKKS